MTHFTVYPAIDLRHGRVVRLQQGDPTQQITFSDNPLETGKRWLENGATWLHVVNLDGAFDEASADNWQALAQLAQLPLSIQFGGGIRTLADIERALNLGVKRVILGTIAVEEPTLVRQAITQFGDEAILVGLDAKNGIAQTRGWVVDGAVHIHNLGRLMKSMGVQTAVHTDIGRDGVLTGVNWLASQQLAEATGLNIIASGGVATLADIMACHEAMGISGVITGRAIYDGRLDLRQAIEAVS